MSAALQQLVKILVCRATAPSDDEDGYYIFKQKGPNLCQYEVTDHGDEGLEEIVAFDVREDTPAVCLVPDGGDEKVSRALTVGDEPMACWERMHELELTLGTQRMLFYLDTSNQLSVSVQEEDEDWQEGGLSGLAEPVVVHPMTQLSALTNGDRIWVFYQTPAGHLAAIVHHLGQWSLAGSIPFSDVAQGASHMPLADGGGDPNKVHVFCLTNHNEICHVQGDFVTDTWSSQIINGSRFPNGISRFIVVPRDECQFDVYAATAASKLVKLSHDGQQLELGGIRGEGFVPLNREESTLIINLNFFSIGKWILGFGSKGATNNGGGKGSGYDC